MLDVQENSVDKERKKKKNQKTAAPTLRCERKSRKELKAKGILRKIKHGVFVCLVRKNRTEKEQR